MKEFWQNIEVVIRSGSITFENHFKQLAVSFKIYANFESLLEGAGNVDKKITLHTFKNINHTFLAVLPIKLFLLMINLAS